MKVLYYKMSTVQIKIYLTWKTKESPKRVEAINSRIALAVFGAIEHYRNRSMAIEGQDWSFFRKKVILKKQGVGVSNISEGFEYFP